MSIQHKTFTVATHGRGMIDITSEIKRFVAETKITSGLCHVFLQHTSASLIFCENADPDVQRDLDAFMARLIPDGDSLFVHTAEGDDDMPAHIRSVLTQNSLSIPVIDGDLLLGTWQGIYLWEHRTSPHKRRVIVSIVSA